MKEINYQGYFIYKGVVYGKGTTVLFTDKVHQKSYFNVKFKNKPHEFVGGSTAGWMNFRWKEGDDWQYDAHSDITIYNAEEEISEIVHPVYTELVPWSKVAFDNIVNKKVQPDVFGGVLLYIQTILIGCIFKDALLIWIAATVIFVVWILNQYRT